MGTRLPRPPACRPRVPSLVQRSAGLGTNSPDDDRDYGRAFAGGAGPDVQCVQCRAAFGPGALLGLFEGTWRALTGGRMSAIEVSPDATVAKLDGRL